MPKFISNNNTPHAAPTIISLSLVLFVVGLLAFVLINADKVSNKMKESIVFTIMLKNNADSIDYERVLNQREEFKITWKILHSLKVTFKHKDSAFSELKEELGEDFSSVLESIHY